jgi:hypothetical protein
MAQIEISQQEVILSPNIQTIFFINLNRTLKDCIFKHVPNIGSVITHQQSTHML